MGTALALLLAMGIGVHGGTDAAAVVASEVAFGAPNASGSLGTPLIFSTSLHARTAPKRVELLTSEAGQAGWAVRSAAVQPGAGPGDYEAGASEAGHIMPNTAIQYRFRAVLADGVVDGPVASITVADDRFAWQELTGDLMTLHWYEGDAGFARNALDIGEAAIDRASQLLGVADVPPVDFFIYSAEGPFRDALGPGVRENVGGQADTSIRTLFGLIEPSEIGSDWVRVLVTHELTHLVFAEAVDNPWHFPPRWLNEGLAVYLAQGYAPSDRAAVRTAASTGDLIPLEGLAGLFPTTRERFSLAYAESVSSVDFFITTYGQATLVRLITSYAAGVTDDEAFSAATGADVAAFDDAWIAAQGAARPVPYGPLPAPPGPVPPDWSSAPPSTP